MQHASFYMGNGIITEYEVYLKQMCSEFDSKYEKKCWCLKKKKKNSLCASTVWILVIGREVQKFNFKSDEFPIYKWLWTL